MGDFLRDAKCPAPIFYDCFTVHRVGTFINLTSPNEKAVEKKKCRPSHYNKCQIGAKLNDMRSGRVMSTSQYKINKTIALKWLNLNAQRFLYQKMND